MIIEVALSTAEMNGLYVERLAWRRMMPEVAPGGLALREAMAELRRSAAEDGVTATGSVRVSATPTGVLGSHSHPFIDMEIERGIRCFCPPKKRPKNK